MSGFAKVTPIRVLPRVSGLNFTRKNLDALGLPRHGRRDYYHDEKVRGLALAVYPTGRKTFVLYRWIDGRPERVLIGPYPDLSIEQARGVASGLNEKIARGENPADHRRKLTAESTLEDAFNEFLEKYKKPKRKSWQEDVKQFRRYLDWDSPVSKWKLAKLSALRPGDIEDLHSRVGKRNGPYAANRLIALLHAVFSKAIKWGWDAPNPARNVEKFREHSRERFIEADEMPSFFAALDADETDPDFRDYFLLSLITGARRANVLAMRWEQISLQGATWTIPDPKAGDPFTVTLVPEAIDILTRRADKELANSEWVFPSNAPRKSKTGHLVEPKGAWKKLLERAGIKNLRLHDLRRTFGSWQAVHGASLQIIGKSLDHRNQKTTEIYARIKAREPVRASVSAATSAIFAAGRPVAAARVKKAARRGKQARRG